MRALLYLEYVTNGRVWTTAVMSEQAANRLIEEEFPLPAGEQLVKRWVEVNDVTDMRRFLRERRPQLLEDLEEQRRSLEQLRK